MSSGALVCLTCCAEGNDVNDNNSNGYKRHRDRQESAWALEGVEYANFGVHAYQCVRAFEGLMKSP